MQTRTLFLALAAVVTLAGCATAPEKTAATPAPAAEKGNELEEHPGVGSHIRARKNKTVGAEAAQKMNAEDFKQQAEAGRVDPTGDQIMQGRTDGVTVPR